MSVISSTSKRQQLALQFAQVTLVSGRVLVSAVINYFSCLEVGSVTEDVRRALHLKPKPGISEHTLLLAGQPAIRDLFVRVSDAISANISRR